LYGHSSGAALCINAAANLGSQKVTKLAVYEAPYNNDPDAQQSWMSYGAKLTTAVSAGQGDEAVILFMTQVGQPEAQIEGMRNSPYWNDLAKLGLTLAYDYAVLGEKNTVPESLLKTIDIPSLVMYGDKSFPFMPTTAETLAALLSSSRLERLSGQDHNVSSEVLAPVLTNFFL
jgi:pimeloyl-ACP methyl ester carboxylesterase